MAQRRDFERDGAVLHSETGTPQGGIVSPILANLYLHHTLDLWFERVVRPRCRGEVLLCRYADDFVCAFRFGEDAQRFLAALPKRLKKFGLEVAPEKTQVLRFSRFPSKHEAARHLPGVRTVLVSGPQQHAASHAPNRT